MLNPQHYYFMTTVKEIDSLLLKLINKSSSLNKGNYDLDSVWLSDLN